MTTKTEPKTWRSGWCGVGNPRMSHDRCAGGFGDLVCVCTCHIQASLEAPAETCDLPLFSGYEPAAAWTPPAAPELSPGRRLTQRQAFDVRRGVHPLMRTPLHELASTDAAATDPRNLPFTCGTCTNRSPAEGHHDWPKCTVGPISHGPATDCRAWWPACPSYNAKENAMTPPPADAAGRDGVG